MSRLSPDEFIEILKQHELLYVYNLPCDGAYIKNNQNKEEKYLALNSSNDENTNIDTVVHEVLHGYFDDKLKIQIPEEGERRGIMDAAEKVYLDAYPQIKGMISQYLKEYEGIKATYNEKKGHIIIPSTNVSINIGLVDRIEKAKENNEK